MFDQKSIAQFHEDGFIITPALAPASLCESIRKVALASIDPLLAPVEYESDVQYPGSPVDRQSLGGNTPRRLLNAYTRDHIFRKWATSKEVTDRVRSLLGCKQIAVSQNHHNCLMTKHPGFSSSTKWHQDIRYWLFDKPDLINVWLALGSETQNNGGMRLIPGSHRLDFDRGRFDGALFFREDINENQGIIGTAINANLECGDVLFFHSRTLHAASKNHSDTLKLSLVFTYRDINNNPLAGTRSASYPDIPCG